MNDRQICLLCEAVMRSEAQLDAHLAELHSDIFSFKFETVGKYEVNNILNENTPSLDINTKSRRLYLKSSLLSFKSSQLDVKRSQVSFKSSLLDPQNSQLDFTKSLPILKCTKCGIQADDENYIETVNGKKAFKCEKCAKMEAYINQTNPDRVVCQVCKKDYKNMNGLLQHHNSVHNDHTRKDKVLCQECPTILATTGSLKNHMSHVHGEKKFQCYPCGIYFAQKINLKKHTISFHCLNNTAVCFVCQQSVTLNVFSKKHKKMIDGKFVSICYYCTKRNKSNVLD